MVGCYYHHQQGMYPEETIHSSVPSIFEPFFQKYSYYSTQYNLLYYQDHRKPDPCTLQSSVAAVTEPIPVTMTVTMTVTVTMT